MPKKNVQILYMPVLHRGYVQFFETHKSVDAVYVIGDDLLTSVDYIRKDLRALTPRQQVEAIKGLGLFSQVDILTEATMAAVDTADATCIFPDEDVSRAVADHFKQADTTFYPVFLRWDRRSVEAVDADMHDETISTDEFDKDVMQSALKKAGTSADIWRRVGAVLITDNETLGPRANQGEPSEHSPWMEGDPRNIFNRGVGIEMSLFTHAEAGLIAEAARRGVKTAGARMYVSTFPCPACAKLIAHSGITTCYYKDGYAVLDGADILKEYGVKLIKVAVEDAIEQPSSLVDYKK